MSYNLASPQSTFDSLPYAKIADPDTPIRYPLVPSPPIAHKAISASCTPQRPGFSVDRLTASDILYNLKIRCMFTWLNATSRFSVNTLTSSVNPLTTMHR